jgi:PAS domain S-box-containing protein
MSATQAAFEAPQHQRLVNSMAGVSAAWDWHIKESRIVGDSGFASLYGLTAKEAADGVSPSVFFSIIHPQDQMRMRLAVGSMLRGAEVFSKEFRLTATDGATRWVQSRGRCYYDENDRPAHFGGALVDITEQKRVEERLRIAQTAGGIGTFEYIEGFATVSVSPQFCDLLGLHPASDLPVTTINAVVCAGDPPIIGATGRNAPGPSSQIEFRVRRPDNGAVRWLTRRGEFLRDNEGSFVRFSGVIYDITRAKEVEQQLRDLNETLEARVEERTRERDRVWSVSRDLHILCARDGTCRSANPAWQSEMKYQVSELPGRLLTELVHPADRDRMSAAIARLAQGEYVENLDVRVLYATGGDRAFSWTCVPEGELFFAAGRDVTQRNELEAQLRQSQKMEAIGQLTGGIAHDFNNLLTGIIGSLNMIRRRIKAGRAGEIDPFMEAATNSAHRAASLTHRLLAFGRRQSLDTRPCDLNELVTGMEELLRRTLGEQIRLTTDLDPALWPAHADYNQLENAVLNLAINARDAMPDGGLLTITTDNEYIDENYARAAQDVTPGDYVVVSVSDTGTGMAPDVVAKAFDPFFTTKPMGKGTGLGLSMIYGFAKQSLGHVRIESELGRGTTVRLYLRRAMSSGAEAGGAKSAHAPRGRGETVLVVEDDETVRLLITSLLSELGYEFLSAADGITGLRILQSGQRIDLLVSDVGLPHINGRQLAEIACEALPKLRVLLVTGYEENARSGNGGSQFEMLTKPFELDTLATKIRDMLEAE